MVYLERADMALLAPREGRGLDVDIQAAVVVQVPAVEALHRCSLALTSREGLQKKKIYRRIFNKK